MTPAELKAARVAFGLSQGELAADLGLGRQGDRTVRRWEAGDREIPPQIEIVFAYWRRDIAEGRDRMVILPA